jgi:hypothetical protein
MFAVSLGIKVLFPVSLDELIPADHVSRVIATSPRVL